LGPRIIVETTCSMRHSARAVVAKRDFKTLYFMDESKKPDGFLVATASMSDMNIYDAKKDELAVAVHIGRVEDWFGPAAQIFELSKDHGNRKRKGDDAEHFRSSQKRARH